MKKNTIFVAARQDSLNIGYLRQWAGELLNDTMDYVETMHDMAPLQNKILILDATESNYQFNLTVDLMKKNYVIFANTFECAEISPLSGLYLDLMNRGLTNFGIIGNNDGFNQEGIMSINVNEWFHTTLTEPNRLRAMDATERIYSTDHKPFKFLFLNGRCTFYRENLWKKLEKNNTLESSLRSWLSVDIGEISDSDWPRPDGSDIQSDIPIVTLPRKYDNPLADYDEIDNVFKDNWPRYRRLKDVMWRNHWLGGHIVPSQYADTYFSLVTETMGFKNPFITEKTYKPILAGHPFIIAGAPGYYQKLHKMGFETFDKLIDESFDLEPNMDQRMTMIAEQVKRLCQNDLDQFLYQCKEICLYNKQYYIDSQWKQWYHTHIKLNEFFQQAIYKLQHLQQKA